MKKINKWLLLLSVVVAMTAILAVSAFAADYTPTGTKMTGSEWNTNQVSVETVYQESDGTYTIYLEGTGAVPNASWKWNEARFPNGALINKVVLLGGYTHLEQTPWCGFQYFTNLKELVIFSSADFTFKSNDLYNHAYLKTITVDAKSVTFETSAISATNALETLTISGGATFDAEALKNAESTLTNITFETEDATALVFKNTMTDGTVKETNYFLNDTKTFTVNVKNDAVKAAIVATGVSESKVKAPLPKLGVLTAEGFRVRVEEKNGLRSLYKFDWTAVPSDVTIKEFGAIVCAANNKPADGVLIKKDAVSGKYISTIEDKIIKKTVISYIDGEEQGKVLSHKENASTEFALTLTNYTDNYNTDVYFAGYVVYERDGQELVEYVEYIRQDGTVDPCWNIYDLSLSAYKQGIVNSHADVVESGETISAKEDGVVYNVLVNGGLLVVPQSGYTTTVQNATYLPTAVTITGKDGATFTGDFAMKDVPSVKVVDTDPAGNNIVTKFEETGTTFTVVKDVDKNGVIIADKYVIIFRGEGALGSFNNLNNIVNPQLRSNWFDFSRTWILSGKTFGFAADVEFPHPNFTEDIWANINYAVIDNGVQKSIGATFEGIGAETIVYGDTFKTVADRTFAYAQKLTTMFKAGTTPTEDVVDISYVTSIGTGSEIFQDARAVTAIHLPADATVTTIAKLVYSDSKTIKHQTATIWVGDYPRQDGILDFRGLTGLTAIGEKCFKDNVATIIMIPDSVNSIASDAFTDAGEATVRTVRQGTYNADVYATVSSLGHIYQTWNGSAWVNYTPVGE